MTDDMNEANRGSQLQTIVQNEFASRTFLNTKWTDLWSLYKTQPLRVSNDDGWQSRLNDGRVFEIVETVGSYIRNAVFFSDHWVQLEAQEPNLLETLPLVNVFFRDAVNTSNFKREFRLFLTQLLLTGNSCMRVFWDEYEGKLKYECTNMYNTYIESTTRYDRPSSYTFNIDYLNEAEFNQRADDGLFPELGSREFEDLARPMSSWNNEYTGQLRETTQKPTDEFVQLVTFYDPVEQEITYLVGDQILGAEDSEYPPYIYATLFETPDIAYGLGIVDSSIGLVLENNVLMNRRLDNMSMSIDNMWLLVDDGVIKPEDIKARPGAVISVARAETLTPLRPPANNFSVTYQEAETLDKKIDRNVGTGAMVSANTYRDGERVTAAEITSVKDAGGNRLSDVYEHIEHVAILPILLETFGVLKRNIKKSQVVKLPSERPNVSDYWEILPKDLRKDFTVKLTATQNVINRDRNIKYLTDFLTTVSQVQQFQAFINWQNLYHDMLVKFGFDDPMRYMAQAQPQQPDAGAPPQAGADPSQQGQPGQSPLDALHQQAGQIGGLPMQNAMQGAIAGGQAPDILAGMQGQTPNPNGAPTDPSQQAAIMAALQQPTQGQR